MHVHHGDNLEIDIDREAEETDRQDRTGKGKDRTGPTGQEGQTDTTDRTGQVRSGQRKRERERETETQRDRQDNLGEILPSSLPELPLQLRDFRNNQKSLNTYFLIHTLKL